MKPIEEAKILADLNHQLLEALEEIMVIVINYSEENDIPLPKNLHYFVSEAHRLIQDISSPPDMQHPDKTPEDATEPLKK